MTKPRKIGNLKFLNLFQVHIPKLIGIISARLNCLINRFVNNNPSTKIIVGHLFGLKEFINYGSQLSNVYFEISTPQLVSEQRLLLAINHFGADRILFGSDVPYGINNQKLNIDRIKNLNISEVEKTKILGNNIKGLLNI